MEVFSVDSIIYQRINRGTMDLSRIVFYNLKFKSSCAQKLKLVKKYAEYEPVVLMATLAMRN